MIPQVLELLAEVGIEARGWGSRGNSSGKRLQFASGLSDSATTQEIEMPRQRKLRAAHRRVDRHLSQRRVPVLP